MLLLLMLLPLAAALLALLLPWHQGRSWLLAGCASLHLALCLFAFDRMTPLGSWFGFDALSHLVLLVTSLLYCGCSFYAVGYFNIHRERGNRVIVFCLLLFLATMTMAIAARHFGVLWVAVEGTTLASAPLIYYNRNRLSIEATWKYLLLCSVGIGLAMVGILFFAYAALVSQLQPVSLQLDVLLAQAPQLAPAWLHAGYAFLLVGFGTKMGLAPLHSWKPDAYGEAPGLVGALLAGGLTSVAFLAILRAVQVMTAAGDGPLARQILLVLGLLSLLLAAVFMVRQPDIKRLLAYSSVEHMGLLAIGIGIGGLATFAALLHLINNALTKGCLFLSAGNIQRAYASKRLSEVRGALATLPLSGGLFLAGFLAITGSPPFGPFISEFTLLRGMMAADRGGIALLVLVLLALVFVGMAATALTATQGEAVKLDTPYADRPLLVVPPLCFLLLVLLLGLYLPEPLQQALQAAAAVVEVRS
ncbi:proton-conducting transporter membrane subunit [Desulfuromonas thiophila]|uniref:Hydrogenase-4 component F n=1 Tax=Desulfuromonas thiophila TaxID=57664 RepID=A0A1G6ZSH1_9BACT|nr:proton-conducting transporter membrane subunit [Desulfuromonas thiophila]SDE05489.1 hydrogenase-4 component F [Desulfuromonas thiophila]